MGRTLTITVQINLSNCHTMCHLLAWTTRWSLFLEGYFTYVFFRERNLEPLNRLLRRGANVFLKNIKTQHPLGLKTYDGGVKAMLRCLRFLRVTEAGFMHVYTLFEFHHLYVIYFSYISDIKCVTEFHLINLSDFVHTCRNHIFQLYIYIYIYIYK